ncbi:AraC family transcriptional regulator [Saccharibacillus sp. CPCC 101409]|uniref:AraC family transcriptional regulator n=1 Tax=Saccharibacillus sp. CPCC 101409 TaxID=3058041 RepID=UPI002674057C|nr:AraC family transcriptional regulator [Saccharibacillus sp. CPCC 101409]MDO3409963.1 AraC family transcriptional regulator [Saccharibacillus sp. CPCC 101409]
MDWTTKKRRGAARNQTSLFYTLFSSFIAVIVLLTSLNLAAYSFFSDNIKKEIILNSSLNLEATAANYEKHIKLIRNFMLGYLFDNDTQILKRGNPMRRYEVVVDAQRSLHLNLNNTLLYLDNLIYYFKNDNFVIERDGTRDASTMFNKFYVQSGYTQKFWDGEMESEESFRVYPAASFRSDAAFQQQALGTFIPVMVKNAYDHGFAFIALLDGSRIYEAFHQNKPDSHFFIVGGQGELLFLSSDSEGFVPDRTALEQKGTGYVRVGDGYYFYRTGAETGFTYFEAVSDRGLARQMDRLNAVMGTLLVLSLLIGLAVSYWFSRRFHNPLAAMIRSAQSLSAVGVPVGEGSRIKEFNLLRSALSDLSSSKEEYRKDLLAKNNLLQQFAYMSRLKKINGGGELLPTPIDTDGPYRLVLSQIEFKERFAREIANAPQRAFNMYKELIGAHFSSVYDNSLTFQLEQDQILSILFVKEEGAARQPDNLDQLVGLLATDIPYCNFTLAISPARYRSADFAETYQDVLDLIKQRRLGEDVQVIGEWVPQPSLMIPSSAEEQELIANLQSGCDEITVPLVDRLLDDLERAGALAQQFQDFAKDVVNRTVKIMYARNLPLNTLAEGGSPYDLLKSCHTLDQYKAFFHGLLSRSASAIRDKKSETDIIIKFVTDYVEEHYGDDLSLDMIAGKLGITGPYLSTYYKEKTGTNFSEYILSVRMHKATEMLRETDLKIQEIAALVGYYTVASFNRVFKRFTGITPSEFRRHHR